MIEDPEQLDYHELEEGMDEFRAELAAQAGRGGFEHLAEVALYTCDQAEILDAAILDLMALGISEKKAASAVTVGIVAGSLMRTIRAAAEAVLAPEVEGDQ